MTHQNLNCYSFNFFFIRFRDIIKNRDDSEQPCPSSFFSFFFFFPGGFVISASRVITTLSFVFVYTCCKRLTKCASKSYFLSCTQRFSRPTSSYASLMFKNVNHNVFCFIFTDPCHVYRLIDDEQVATEPSISSKPVLSLT